MLSIVIVNWNTSSLLHACLASIYSHPSKRKTEIIVVDNASSDDSAAMVRRDFPNVVLVDLPTNTGYAAGNNHGIEQARGDFVLTLNPDTEFIDDSLDRALRILEDNPQFGILGARQIGIDGKTQRSVRGFPTLAGIFGDVTKLGRLFPRSSLASYRLEGFNYEIHQEAPQPMGTFLMFTREALRSVGDEQHPFDEEFPIFFNEVDLLYRLHKRGVPCLYSPEVHILHHGGESTKLVKKSMIWESHRSLIRYMRKHLLTQWNLPLILLVSGIVYAGAFVRARGYSPTWTPVSSR